MRFRVLAGVLLVPVGLVTGCAPLNPPLGTPGEPNPYIEVVEAISDRPSIPGPAEMLPAVELVSFPFQRQGAARRDTVRGVARVAEWLDRLGSQMAGTGTSFDLRTSEILVCEGAAGGALQRVRGAGDQPGTRCTTHAPATTIRPGGRMGPVGTAGLPLRPALRRPGPGGSFGRSVPEPPTRRRSL